MTAPLEDRMEAGGMPGTSCGIHRASAVTTLAVSVVVTLVLLLAAAEMPRDDDACAASPASATRTC
jgi:hypothetical protein